MKGRAWIAVAIIVSTLLAGVVAYAGNQGKHKGKGHHKEILPPSEIVFTQEERTIVGEWYSDGRGLPPGLAKHDRLPPGLEKHLRERGSLPPGLQKKVAPLPPELEHRMRRLPSGYRRVVIGGNVILMNEKTAVIYDIIRDIIH